MWRWAVFGGSGVTGAFPAPLALEFARMPDVADTQGRQMGRIVELPSACWPETPIAKLPGVGPAQGQRLGRLGIATVSDLLLHLPRRYEDTRNLVPLRELRDRKSTRLNSSHL